MKFNLLALTALSGVLMVACGNGTTGSSTGGGDTGGSGTGGSVTVGNGGSTNSTGGGLVAPDCYDISAAADAPDETTVVGQGICSSTQVDDFFANCFDSTDPDACGTWEDADATNLDCEGCVLGLDLATSMFTGNSPALEIVSDQGNVIVNQLVCEAAAQGLPQCGPSIADYIVCAVSACSSCGDADYSDCTDYSFSADSECATLFDAIPAECDPVINAEALDPKCDGADFQGAYVNVSNYFCGPAL